MKPNTIASFAAGLLIATSISGIVFLTTNDEKINAEGNTVEANTPEEEEEAVAHIPTVDEMKELLTESGYIVQTSEEVKQKEEEIKKQVADAKASEEKKENETQEKEEEKKEEVKQVTVTVSSGMTSYEVGQTLNNAGIIKETPLEFSLLVDKKGVANYLKLGSYKIDSTMSTDKIISTIFKKPS